MRILRAAQLVGITALFVLAATRPSVAGYADDRAQIEDLQARYLFAMDWGDTDTYASTFTEDGILDHSGGVEKGRKAIHDAIKKISEDMAKQAAEQNPGLRPARMRHSITDIVLEIKGNTAKGVAYWMVFYDNNPERKAELLGYGHYEDELVKQNGQWLFSKRKIYNEQKDGREASDQSPAW